jgi:hypothetical protein
MASQHIQNGHNMFWTLFSIHCLLKCAPSCMFHVDQSWCTPWHDWISPTTFKLGAKGIDSWWWVDLVHDNWHTFITSFLFDKMDRDIVGNFECWMNPLLMFSLKYSWNITSLFWASLFLGGITRNVTSWFSWTYWTLRNHTKHLNKHFHKCFFWKYIY